MIITCYVVPLLFFAVMGGIFASINPEAKYTLIQSMTVLGVSTGALIPILNRIVFLLDNGFNISEIAIALDKKDDSLCKERLVR